MGFKLTEEGMSLIKDKKEVELTEEIIKKVYDYLEGRYWVSCCDIEADLGIDWELAHKALIVIPDCCHRISDEGDEELWILNKNDK